MVTAQQFAEAAASLKGARFRHRGRTTTRCDCIGLPFVAAAICGLSVPPFIDYEPTPRPDVLLAAVADRCEPRDWIEWRLPGRLVVMRQTHDGPPRHFAVSTGSGWGIHMESRAAMRQIETEQELIHSAWLVRGVIP
jgi:hypothetical protein